MNIGLIFAGGVGTRMNSKDKPKQFLEIYGKPIIIYTIEHFEENKEIDAIVVVCVEDWIDYLYNLIAKYKLDKVKMIVPGGKTGQISIYKGLLVAKQLSKTDDDVVLIHDGVRPLISSELISQNILDVKKYGTSITSSIVKETIVEIDDENNISNVQNRKYSRIAKAPQCFKLNDILSAHERALNDGIENFIDSCTMMNHYGFHLHMTVGPYDNLKITTPDDFYTMRALLQAKEDKQIYVVD